MFDNSGRGFYGNKKAHQDAGRKGGRARSQKNRPNSSSGRASNLSDDVQAIGDRNNNSGGSE